MKIALLLEEVYSLRPKPAALTLRRSPWTRQRRKKVRNKGFHAFSWRWRPNNRVPNRPRNQDCLRFGLASECETELLQSNFAVGMRHTLARHGPRTAAPFLR